MHRNAIGAAIDGILRRWDRFAWAMRKRGVAGALRRVAASRRLPMDAEQAYAAWCARHEPPLASVRGMPGGPVVAVFVPAMGARPDDLSRTATSLLSQTVAWRLTIILPAATVPSVEGEVARLAGRDARIAVVARGVDIAPVGADTPDLVVVVAPGVVLAPFALRSLATARRGAGHPDLLYGDEDRLSSAGQRRAPCFKPGFSPELLRASAYFGRLVAFAPALAARAGGIGHGDPHELALRLSEQASRVEHLAQVLHHVPEDLPRDDGAVAAAVSAALVRSGERGDVVSMGGGRFRVRYAIRGQPLVSVVIPTRDRVDLLRRAVASVLEGGGWGKVELIVVDNGSAEEETRSFLAALPPPHRVLTHPGPFDWAGLNNEAARLARGDLLLFLNNDVEALAPGWVTALLEHAQRPGIGAVGAKLLYPDRTVQHAGIALGMDGFAGHVFRGAQAEDLGPCGTLAVARECSAVTGACLMIRRDLFLALGGFDARLRIAFNDVDLCLRAADRGARTICTPHATLIHYESASRPRIDPRREVLHARRLWGVRALAGDPYISPHLDLDAAARAIRIR